MNTTPSCNSVQDHPSSPATYVRHGWKIIPIPQGTKGPTTRGWNRPENTISDPANLPHGHGFGLAHAYSGTMALDVDHWDRAVQELQQHGIDLQGLYDAPDAVTIESGKPGHGKLLYRMPLGAAYPSKKLIDTDSNNLKYNYLDFRCGTSNNLTVQDVLPPSIHPETQQPYRWGGRGHWTRLPEIPAPLLNFWRTLVEQDQQRTINDGAGVNASWEDVQSALDSIPADTNRDEWVQIGMAIHWAGVQIGDMETAFHIWDEWSATSSEKYKGQRDLITQWQSFKADNGVTLGTLFHIAKQYGWTRPLPNPQELFKGLVPKDTTTTDQPMDIFSFMRKPVPDVNFDLFPKVLKDRALEVSDSMGSDPLVSLFAGLACASGAVDSRIRLQLNPSFKVPPVLWCMTIGNPSDMKSPASKPMFEVLKQIEIEDREPYKQRFLAWQGKEAAYNAAHKSFLEYHSSPESQLDNDSPVTVPELENAPAPVKITVSDITSQKLVRHAAERPRGLLCWLDEMNSWIHGMTDSRSGENRSCWVQSYESSPYEYDRVGAGSIWCENLAVSIYGNVQPRVLRTGADTRHGSALHRMAADGLIQRFIPVVLRPHYSDRKGKPIPDCFSTKPIWDQAVRTVYGLQEGTYTLTPEAHDIFDGFQDWFITLKKEERLIEADQDYQSAIGKLTGTVGRLALIWHVLEAPYNPQVSGDLMQRVVTFVQDYLVPSLRYLFDEVSDKQSLDAWFYGYVLQHSGLKETITLRDLRHAARRKLEQFSPYDKDRIIHDIMGLMEKSQWVQLVDHDARRNSFTWIINPQLAVVFKEQREMVIRVKQKRMDELIRKAKGPGARSFVPGYDPEKMDPKEIDDSED